MSGGVSFRLRIRRQRAVQGLGRVTRRFRVHGNVYFGGGTLTIEWTGTMTIETRQLFEVGNETVTVPLEALDVAASDLRSARLRGGWILPFIELEERALAALDPVPSENHGLLRLWISRGDRERAARLVAAVQAAISDASATPAEGVTAR